jgi:PRC-barrel domain
MSGTGTGTGAVSPATNETSDLIASDKVEGTAVYNRDAERLGSVYNFMVNKRSGQVAYAVLSFGGFLGIGSSYHPLPWNELTYDTSLRGYVVNRTRQQFEGAPSYSASELSAWDDAEYRRRIDQYYSGLGPGLAF